MVAIKASKVARVAKVVQGFKVVKVVKAVKPSPDRHEPASTPAHDPPSAGQRGGDRGGGEWSKGKLPKQQTAEPDFSREMPDFSPNFFLGGLGFRV